MTYSNLQKYTQKGQRLGLFAREVDGQLEIFRLTCSKKDHFSKKEARMVYQAYIDGEKFDGPDSYYHPEIYTIPLVNGKPKVTFLRHCNEQYYSLREAYVQVNGKATPRIDTIWKSKFRGQKLVILKYLSR